MQQNKMQNAKVPQDRKHPVQAKQPQPRQQKPQQAPQAQPQRQPVQQKPQNLQKQQNPQTQQRPQQQISQQPMQSKQPPQAQKPQQAQPQVRLEASENVVFVGQKPSMAYVLAVMTQFNSGNAEVRVKARGKSISRAVDVAEIIRRKFLEGMRVKSIRIGTEEYTPENSAVKVPVSTIELVLCK
jgi:DNA-binding protein Alba